MVELGVGFAGLVVANIREAWFKVRLLVCGWKLSMWSLTNCKVRRTVCCWCGCFGTLYVV